MRLTTILTVPFLAAACVIPVRLVETDALPDVHVSYDEQANEDVLRVYRNLPQHEFERRLVELAQTRTLEEAWVYDRKSKTAWEVGVREQWNLVYSRYDAVDDPRKERELVHYHLHPLESVVRLYELHERTKEVPLTPQQLEERLNTTNQVALHTIPYDTEPHFLPDGTLRFVETRVADHQGITVCTWDIEKMKQYQKDPLFDAIVGVELRAAQTKYVNGEISITDLMTRCGQLGFFLYYLNVTDFPVRIEAGEEGRLYQLAD